MQLNSLTHLLAPVLYLDPGSGSLLVQLLIAAVLGIGVAVRIYWSKIKTLFSGKNTTAPGQPDGVNTNSIDPTDRP